MASLICRVARLRSNCFRQSFSAFLGLSLRTTLVLVTSIGMVGMPASLVANSDAECETESQNEEHRDSDGEEEALSTARRLRLDHARSSSRAHSRRIAVRRALLPLRQVQAGHRLPNGLLAPLRR